MIHRLAFITLATCVLVGPCVVPAGAQQSPEEIRATKRATAVRISEPIRVDGVLDDAAWKRGEPARDFYQQYPDEFQPATRRTEVWFLYDDTTLYVGAVLHGDAPETLITNDLKRDFQGVDTDTFCLILDTFLDRTNSYGFLANPGGAMRDAVNADNGRLHDPNWNGAWVARSAVLPDGWSVELAIPFQTLRFPEHQSQEWGLNVMRTSRLVNEKSMWAPVPRQFSHYNVAYAGRLVGIADVHPGHNVQATPFATASGRRAPGETAWKADGGLDLKWGITSSVLLDATWRTDFSQVEADEQQINLTRFSQFFPEKRQFFLESPGSFQIGLPEQSRRDLVPFFTRRIGLAGGQPVPVVGGVRLTGRPGRQSIGILNMQTESFNGDPGDNFTAMVLRRRVSNTTSLGGFYFGRESRGPDSFNRVAGLDVRFSPSRTFDVEAFAMRSGTAGAPGDWSGRTGFLLDTSRHRARLAWLHVGDTFRHDLGFVRRRGIGMWFGNYSYRLRPAGTSARPVIVREHTLGANFEATSNDRYSQVLTGIGGVTYSALFADEGNLSASVNSTFERVDARFGIGPTLTVGPGTYRFTDADVSYSSNRSAPLSGSIRVGAGEFWTGRQRELSGGLRFRLNAHLAASATLGRNVISLPEGSFTGDLIGVRLDTSFTPRMFLNAFIQYNGETDTWLSNIRYNLIHRPLSDIYLVWNETRLAGEVRRALLMKYTHLLAF